MSTGNAFDGNRSNPRLGAAEIMLRFEDAWARSPRPAIEPFLPKGPERRQVLIQLVHIDLERRIKAGEWVSVEAYVGRFPELAADPAIVVDLIAAEYRQRLRTATPATRDECLRRFPQLCEAIMARLADADGHQGHEAETLVPESAPPAKDSAESATLPPATSPEQTGFSTSGWPVVRGFEILDVLGRGDDAP
jgi:hypothetical protein